MAASHFGYASGPSILAYPRALGWRRRLVPGSAGILDGAASGGKRPSLGRWLHPERRKETWSRCARNHDFGVQVRPVVRVGWAVSDPVLESGFSHPRTTPARAQGGLDT